MGRKKRAVDPWKNWMGKIRFPVPKTELLDQGLAGLIRKMNVPGRLNTFGSCLHDGRVIFFLVESDRWFREKILPQILLLNKKKYGYHLMKVYDGCMMESLRTPLFRQRDQDGNYYYWEIKSNWHSPKEFVKGLESVKWN